MVPKELNFNSSYAAFLCNRNNLSKSAGGGVGVIISNNFNAVVVFKDSSKGYEILIIDIIAKGHSKIRIISIYFPPNLTKNAILTSKTLKKFHTYYSIICDFNKPKINWLNNSSTILNDIILLDFINNYEYTQHIQSPTHISGSTLDLLLTNNEYMISNTQVEESFSTSDHYTIHFNLGISKDISPSKKYRNYSIENLNRI